MQARGVFMQVDLWRRQTPQMITAAITDDRTQGHLREEHWLWPPPTPPPPPPKPKVSQRVLRGLSNVRTCKVGHQHATSLTRFKEKKDSSMLEHVSSGSRRRNARSVQPLPLPVPRHQADENPLPLGGRSKTPLDRSRRKGKQRRSLTVDDLEPHCAHVLFDESDQDLKEGKPQFGHFDSSPSPSPSPERRRESNQTRSRSRSTDRLSNHNQAQRGRSPSKSSSPEVNRGKSRSKSIDMLVNMYKLVRNEGEMRLRRKGSGSKEKDTSSRRFPALPYSDDDKEKDDPKKSKQYGIRGRGQSVLRQHVAASTSRSKSKSRRSHTSSSRSSSRPCSKPELKFDCADKCKKHPIITLTRKTILTSQGLETVRDTCPLCREEAQSEVAITNINSVKKSGSPRHAKKGNSSTDSLTKSMDRESTAVSLTHSHGGIGTGDGSTISHVLNMPYTTPLGEDGWYTGEVNEFGKPHGEGVMRSKNGYVTKTLVWCHGYPKHYLDNRLKSLGGQGHGGRR
jgi:hypothetical protein